jgi:hypothetical protein
MEDNKFETTAKTTDINSPRKVVQPCEEAQAKDLDKFPKRVLYLVVGALIWDWIAVGVISLAFLMPNLRFSVRMIAFSMGLLKPAQGFYIMMSVIKIRQRD